MYIFINLSDGLYLITNALAARPLRQTDTTAGIGLIGADLSWSKQIIFFGKAICLNEQIIFANN